MARRKAPHIPDALLDQLLAGADPKSAFEADGLLDGLKKALAERALNAEMDHHLAGEEAGNTRNGYGRKTVTTETGRIELAIPRDRQATFDPQLIARYQRRFPGFDDKIVSMYARGMSTREIVGHLRELLRDRGLARPDQRRDRRRCWRRSRPGRSGRWSRSTRSCSSTPCGSRCATRAWSGTRPSTSRSGCAPTGPRRSSACGWSRNEGAKFWLRVMNELRNRGVEDVAPGRCRRAEGLPRCDPGGVPRGDGSSPSLVDQAARRNRRRRRSRLARPYMARFKSLRRVIWPSACPLLQGSVSADRTASLS